MCSVQSCGLLLSCIAPCLFYRNRLHYYWLYCSPELDQGTSAKWSGNYIHKRSPSDKKHFTLHDNAKYNRYSSTLLTVDQNVSHHSEAIKKKFVFWGARLIWKIIKRLLTSKQNQDSTVDRKAKILNSEYQQ